MIQSILRMSSVLDYIAHHNGETKLADISRELGINKSTLHGILQTLVYCGFLSQDPGTTLYSLGLKTYELGKIYEKTFSLVDVARPFMQVLSDEFGENVHLSIESSREVLYIDCIQSKHAVRTASSVGGTDPLYSTSAGKLILTYADEDYVESYLKDCDFKALTPNTITSAEELREQFQVIRRQGYAIDTEEVELGLRCISVPVFGAGYTLQGIISVSGPTPRMDAKLADVLRRTVEVCGELSQILGCQLA